MSILSLEAIETINVDAEHGFAWAESDSGQNLFQVCCDSNGVIDSNDAGHDWGICGDCNGENYDDDQLDACLEVFLQAAKKQGLNIV